MDNMKYLVFMWVIAFVCIIIGIYAMKSKKPVRLYTSTPVLPEHVTDVKAYNHAIGKMWCLFSIPLWMAGIVDLCFPAAAIIIFGLLCIVGIGGTVWYYHIIEEKYMMK